jgi:hypothetical protein
MNDDKQENIIENEKNYAWKKEQEQMVKKWADKALCYKIMHERANKKYWCLNAWFNIPIIIISTITGTGNFASSNLKQNSDLLIFIIGAFNIFAAILATIASFTGSAQKLESHRVANISWDKFARKIQIELAKNRTDRIKAKYFINHISEEYDHILASSPSIPNDIIRWFKKIIELGQYEDLQDDCIQCFYDCCCFPCGCNICIFRSLKRNIDLKSNIWSEIELPEILGQIKPIEIAHSDTDDLITSKDNTVDANKYELYNGEKIDTIL